MKDHLIFEKTFKNRKTNGSNHAYWTKFFRSILSDDVNIGTNTTIDDRFQEIAPMFYYVSKQYEQAVVIYQYNIDSIPENNKIIYKHYLTAWTSKRVISSKLTKILTIYLLPSSENIETVKKLINAWYFKKKEVNGIISNIYDNQQK